MNRSYVSANERVIDAMPQGYGDEWYVGVENLRLAEDRLGVFHEYLVALRAYFSGVERRGLADLVFFFSSRRRHTRCSRDWSSDVCSSDLPMGRMPRLRQTDPLDVRRRARDTVDLFDRAVLVVLSLDG